MLKFRFTGKDLLPLTLPFLMNTFSLTSNLNFLVNDLPSCFFKLKLILEFCIISIISDFIFCNIEHHNKFYYELKWITNYLARLRNKYGNSYIEVFMRKFLPKFLNYSDVEKIMKLYYKLSAWTGALNYFNVMFDISNQRRGVPSYFIVSPLIFRNEDKIDIERLDSAVLEIKEIFESLVNRWKEIKTKGNKDSSY